MCHQVNLQPVAQTRSLDGLASDVQPYQLAQRQDMDAAHVEVRISRGEPIEVRAAERGEQKWVGLLRKRRPQAHVS
jgi:hypothetical protein